MLLDRGGAMHPPRTSASAMDDAAVVLPKRVEIEPVKTKMDFIDPATGQQGTIEIDKTTTLADFKAMFMERR